MLTASGQKTQICKVKQLSQSIVLAFKRVNVQPERVLDIAEDIVKTFPTIDEKDLIEAVKRGALGEFGRTYRMSTQEVCIWVREYIKSTSEKKGYDVDEIQREYDKIKR